MTTKRIARFNVLVTLLAIPSLARSADEEPPKPINVTTINTEANESDPHPSLDSLTLYYSSDAQRKLDKTPKLDIRVATRTSRARLWDNSKLITSNLRSRDDDCSVFVTAPPTSREFQYVFFATKNDKEQGNFDIYSAQKLNLRSAFAVRTFINPISTPDDEMHPWLTRDGRNLFFSRRTKEGWRVLYASRPMSTGLTGFGKPKLVESLPVGFHHATLTPDAMTTYLQGPLEKGRWGLFVSKRSDGKWSKPEPLNVNHPAGKIGDVAPNLSRDGRWLYFASDRPGGKGNLDVYIIPVAKLKARGE